jgi:hypothetical protein
MFRLPVGAGSPSGYLGCTGALYGASCFVSPEFQVAILHAIREALSLQPGQKVQVMLCQIGGAVASWGR